jgi:hypothetical protein
MKILSIDFDYIMFPCISLYNDIVGGDANPTQLWIQMEYERKLKDFLSYDANAYDTIMQLCVKNISNKATIVPITSHEEIITFLEKHCSVEMEQEENFVDNVDFHHDVLYNKDDFNSIYNFGDKSCANWGGYLLCKGMVQNYTWYDTPHSAPFALNHLFTQEEIDTHPPVQELKTLFDNKYTVKHIGELSSIQDDYDIVFLCLSPQWVPYKYHHLYDLIINTCKTIAKSKETPDRVMEVF